MSEELEKLIDGNKQFRKNFNTDLFDELVKKGQKPKIMMVACSDSRVDPSLIFNCPPGELFIIRSMANLIPPYNESSKCLDLCATLEFGNDVLKVEQIIILGHTDCGGIKTLLKNGDTLAQTTIDKWLEVARPAYNDVKRQTVSFEEKVALCEQYVLINSLQNLSQFPSIQERIKSGLLSLHAWYVDLSTGIIHRYDQRKKKLVYSRVGCQTFLSLFYFF